MEIPTVDLSDFLSNDSKRKEGFINDLGNAYTTIGFASIVNHGIPRELITELYTQIEAFFALPIEIKKKYEGLNQGQRGYTSFGKEHAKDSQKGDLKEFWHFGQELEIGDPLQEEYPKNIYCEELPEFNEIGKLAYQTFEQTGEKILQALALYLDLSTDFFTPWIRKGNSILRPIYYPPLEGEPRGAVRAGAHEDINLITLLIGASAEGLEVLHRDGRWIKAKPAENQIIVNVGDMLQRLSNNRLRSTTHRVVNPPREAWNTPRYSVPFFLHPRSEMPLNCLENCVSEEHPKAYEDITAGEYLDQRLKEIGLNS
jgi:isopenicillin N synthase-like dioxygenase